MLILKVFSSLSSIYEEKQFRSPEEDKDMIFSNFQTMLWKTTISSVDVPKDNWIHIKPIDTSKLNKAQQVTKYEIPKP